MVDSVETEESVETVESIESVESVESVVAVSLRDDDLLWLLLDFFDVRNSSTGTDVGLYLDGVGL